MKIKYTEQRIKEAFHELLASVSDAPDPVANFVLTYPLIGIIKKANGEKRYSSCMLDFDKEGLLVVLMHPFQADKAVGALYLHFSDMKNIKIRKGWLYTSITLKYPRRTGDYKFQIVKRALKDLPNQKSNLQHLTNKLSKEFSIIGH